MGSEHKQTIQTVRRTRNPSDGVELFAFTNSHGSWSSGVSFFAKVKNSTFG
jgi:hypothetical protein